MVKDKDTFIQFISYHKLLIFAILCFIALVYVIFVGITYSIPLNGFYGLNGFGVVDHNSIVVID